MYSTLGLVDWMVEEDLWKSHDVLLTSSVFLPFASMLIPQ